MRIMFTGVGRRIELLEAFRAAALRCGKSLTLYGADLSETAPALVFCDETRLTVRMNDPRYIPQLLDICEKDHIDLLIPTIDTDLIVLSESAQRFAACGTRVLISAPEKIRICRDKLQTFRFFMDCGLLAPEPCADWTRYDGGFPAFIKPRNGSSSVNAYKVENREALRFYAEKIDNYIIQPFLSGVEYTVDIFCSWEGEPIWITPRERITVRSGEVLKSKICMDARMIQESEQICRAFKPCGPLTVQLIRDADGRDWFIEINPRYGGGAPLSMKAGARSAETILRLLDGEAPAADKEVIDGAVYSRFDHSVCVQGGGLRKNGVIFDLDDTLYPERDYIDSGFRAISKLLGQDCTERLWQLFEAGLPAIDCLAVELHIEARRSELLECYRTNIPELRLYPEVLPLLQKLRADGRHIGIITDGRPEGQRNKLKALGLYELVDDVIITDELGGPQFRKPCDIAFRILQTRWRMDMAEMVYIGDRYSKDRLAPTQLGMQFLCVDNTAGLYYRESCPIRRYSFAELAACLGVG